MSYIKILIVSTSTVHGKGYLEYINTEIKSFFEGCKNIAFIPFARPGGISWDEYTNVAKNKFESLGFNMKGIHEFNNIKEALVEADGFFTGGGNTFELLNQLYHHDLMELLAQLVNDGKPYMGTSAGSNITGTSIKTTNDMPIIYPPSFKALNLVPFNINPHYLDPDPSSTHMGETRETRIKEFHVFNKTSVLGLREGSWLEVSNNSVVLRGNLTARLFEQNKKPVELKSGVEVIV